MGLEWIIGFKNVDNSFVFTLSCNLFQKIQIKAFLV